MTAEEATEIIQYSLLALFDDVKAGHTTPGYATTEEAAEKILAALDAAGWVVVPMVATEAMCDEGANADMPGGRWGEPSFRESTIDNADAQAVWQAMLAARPR